MGWNKSIPEADLQPAFLPFGKHYTVGTIFILVIPDLSSNCMAYCNLVLHFLHAKIMEIGAEDLIL